MPGISGTAHLTRLAKSQRVGRVALALNFLSLSKRILKAPPAHPSLEFLLGIGTLNRPDAHVPTDLLAPSLHSTATLRLHRRTFATMANIIQLCSQRRCNHLALHLSTSGHEGQNVEWNNKPGLRANLRNYRRLESTSSTAIVLAATHICFGSRGSQTPSLPHLHIPLRGTSGGQGITERNLRCLGIATGAPQQ